MAWNTTSWTTDGSTTSVTVGNYSLYQQFNFYEVSPSQGYHYPMIVGYHHPTQTQSSAIPDTEFGNGTDPSTSLDISGAAADWKYYCMCYWYLIDNIVIDEVRVIGGCDADNDLNFHLMSYDIDSSTNYGDLSNGTLLAHIGSSMENGGVSASTIKIPTLTIDSGSVSSGKVILAFVENEEGTGDITTQLIVKYHLI